MAARDSAFWDDLGDDLRDPEFRRAYVLQCIRIATIDRMVADLDAARAAAGRSKAELARAVDADPASVRRLFSASEVNPTLGTLSEIAAALGLRITLSPLSDDTRTALDASLLAEGEVDVDVIARLVETVGSGAVTTRR